MSTCQLSNFPPNVDFLLSRTSAIPSFFKGITIKESSEGFTSFSYLFCCCSCAVPGTLAATDKTKMHPKMALVEFKIWCLTQLYVRTHLLKLAGPTIARLLPAPFF